MSLKDRLAEKQAITVSGHKSLKERLAEKQALQPKPVKPNTDFFVGMQNIGNDIGKAFTGLKDNLPVIAEQIKQSAVDNAKALQTAEGRASTASALARGAVTGAVDLFPNIAGLGADLVNSYAGTEVISKEGNWHRPMAHAMEELANKAEIQKNLAVPVIKGAEDNYKYTGPQPSLATQYIVGADPNAQNTQFAQGLGNFIPDLMAGGAIAGARKVANAGKVAKLAEANKARMLADTQKAKYARQIEKLAQVKAEQAVAKNKYIDMAKDNTIAGGVIGATEGENLEERGTNAVIGGLLGAGGSAVHAGGAKIAKSKPVANAIDKVKTTADNFINSNQKLANVVGTTSRALNQNTSSELANKYKGLDELLAQNTTVSKNLTKAQEEVVKIAQSMSKEDSVDLHDALKKGDVERAKTIIRNTKQQTKPQRTEGDLSHVEDETGINTPKQQETPLKTQSDMSDKVNHELSAEDLYHLLKDDGFVEELVHVNDVTRLGLGKEKPLNDKVTKLPAGEAETMPWNERTKGKEDIYSEMHKKDVHYNEHQRQELSELIDAQKRDIYQQDEAYTDGIDNVNKNYIGEGFHEEKVTPKEQYSRNIIPDDATPQEIVRGQEFMRFYSRFKKHGYNPAKQRRLYENHMSKLSEQDKVWTMERMSEQADIDVQANKVRSIKDADTQKAKLDEAVSAENNAIKNISDTEINAKKELTFDRKNVEEGDKVLVNSVRKQTSFHFNNIAKKSGMNYFKARQEKAKLIKNVSNKTLDGDIASLFDKADNKQDLYNALLKDIQGIKNETTRKYAIDKLNKVAKTFDTETAKIQKTTIAETTDRVRYNKDLDALKEATGNKDIESINRILASHGHKLHKAYGLNQQQLDIIADAYSAKSNDFIERLNNYKQKAKELFEAQGENKKKSLSRYEAETLAKLKEEYSKLKGIIKNSFTDFSERERFEANRETGRYERTGDTWNKDASGVTRQRFEDVLRDIESAFNKAVPENAINKYKVDGEVDVKKVQADIDKLKDPNNITIDKDIVELMSAKLDNQEYVAFKRVAEKQAKGESLTNEDLYAIKDYKYKTKEYVQTNLQDAYGGLVNWTKKQHEKTETIVSAKANDVVKGADVVVKAKEVADGFEHKFVSKLAKAKGQCQNAIKAIKTFADSKQHNGIIPDKIREYVENKQGSKIKTTYSARDVLKDFIDSDDILKKIYEYIDPNEHFYIVDDNFRTPDSTGATSYSGDFVFIKFRDEAQFIGTTAHEMVHKFIRQNIVKGKYDLVKELTGITKEDIEINNKATKIFSDFKETPEGKIYLEHRRTDKNKLDSTTRKIVEKGDTLIYDVVCTKEEKLAYKLGEKIKGLYNEKYGRNTDRRHAELGRVGYSDKNEIARNSRETQGRELPENIRAIIGKIKQVAQENGVDEREAVRRLSNEDKLALHEYYSNNNKTIVKNDVDASMDVVEEIDNKIGLSSILKHVEDLKSDSKKVQTFIEDLSKQNEKILIEYGALTEGRAKGALKKQHEAGEGVYYQSYGRTKHKKNYIEYPNRKRGLFGFKKMDGKSNDRLAIDTVEYTIKRNLDINRAKQIVDYIRENFAEPVKRGVSHSDDYIPVNTNLLFTAIFQRKTPKWYETISKGKKSIKQAFGDDADALKELTELHDNNNKADAYIPKEVYKKLFDGTGENPAEYFANYVKSHKNILSKDGGIFLAKTAGVMTDIINSQFKKTVLTTGSFFTNNRLGNQIMLMAKAGNLGDYVKGVIEAVKMKDNAPVEILESTLMEACEEIGRIKQPSGWVALDNFANLLEGNKLDTSKLKGFDKLKADTANVCIGLPNKAWVKVTETMMRINERAERFERKQAYSQAITKAKKDKVIGTAQKAIAINEFHKHLQDNPELKGYIIKKTEDILGDYNNFTNVEKKVFKRLVPFYSWHRTIFRHTINLAKENPTRASLIALKLYLMNTRDDGREDWQRGAIDNILGLKLPKGYVINKKHVIPYSTIREDLGGSNPVSSVTPALKVPYEIAKGEKSFKPASEIQHPDWKRVTKTVGKGANRHKVTGYFNKDTGEFVKGTPWQVRAGYAKKEAFKVVHPWLDNAIVKGTPEAIVNGRFPDKQYDTALFDGFYNGEYIGKFNGKKKYRSAKNELPLGMQLANRIAGVGFQKDTKDPKLARKQELYKNKKRRNK